MDLRTKIKNSNSLKMITTLTKRYTKLKEFFMMQGERNIIKRFERSEHIINFIM